MLSPQIITEEHATLRGLFGTLRDERQEGDNEEEGEGGDLMDDEEEEYFAPLGPVGQRFNVI